MITTILPSTNSTQLTNIALDDMFRELSDASGISLAAIQKVIDEDKTPITDYYNALVSYCRAEKACADKIEALQQCKTDIAERLRKVQKLLFSSNDPAMEPKFRFELSESQRLEKEIDQSIERITRIYNKCQKINRARIKEFKNIVESCKKIRANGYTLPQDLGESS